MISRSSGTKRGASGYISSNLTKNFSDRLYRAYKANGLTSLGFNDSRSYIATFRDSKGTKDNVGETNHARISTLMVNTPGRLVSEPDQRRR